VGVRKVHSRAELADAANYALTYDRKILVEEFVPGKEIECAMLGNTFGNEEPLVSLVGEIRHASEFYTYETKYLDDELVIEVPARLPQAVAERAQALSKAAFQVLECEGMARIDMFLKPTGEVLLNEINTIPGFTATSTYPQLWGASGITYEALIDRLIQLAIARHEQESALKTGTAK
jgi:D-alanine-D-alanine ligase